MGPILPQGPRLIAVGSLFGMGVARRAEQVPAGSRGKAALTGSR
ncbi:hypothetical protein [Streptomyces flaveolus]|nr:hypothetical protein [Streptomyces flaveolus]